MNKKIPLGEILKPHGIKGELKILFYNEESKSLQKDQKVFLESPQKNIIEYKIERIFYSFRKNRIKFFDINTIDEADDLRGCIVNVDRHDLPKINDTLRFDSKRNIKLKINKIQEFYYFEKQSWNNFEGGLKNSDRRVANDPQNISDVFIFF